MATLVDLEHAKLHLRVDTGDEDTLITGQLGAAEALSMNWIRRKVFATQDALDAAIAALPADQEDDAEAKLTRRGIVVNDLFVSAVLLTLGALYANREVDKPPSAAQWLLDPLKVYA